MVYNIYNDDILSSIESALEQVGRTLADEKVHDILNKIEEAMPGLIEIMAIRAREIWQDEAITKKTGWGVKYAKAIDYSASGNVATVFIDESITDKGSNKPNAMFAMMMEEGVQSWSIKDALLKSDKAKIGPAGVRYIIVPFPVSTPRTPGQGTMSSQFGGREMTQEIYQLVKSGKNTLKSGKAKNNSDISGLTKYETRQLHGQYGIFRCVSENSKGWQYPNKSPVMVYPKIFDELDKEIGKIISHFVEGIIREYK